MNPFEQLSITAKPVWQQRQEQALEKRRATMRTKAPDVDTPAEKKLRQQQRLTANWKAAKIARFRELADTYNDDLKHLRKMLRRSKLTSGSAEALICYVATTTWLQMLPEPDRTDILGLIAGHITRLRERNGLPPYDDSIFDEEPTAFDKIKQILEAETESAKHDRRAPKSLRARPEADIFA